MVVTIGVCTSAYQANIEALLSSLISILPMITIRMVPLPYNDLDSYRLEQQGLDGLILCHSIHNRRFSITDVLDAIYDKFLPRAKRFWGKENVVVIAHDFSWPFRKTATMENFRKKQPTAVDCSSLVILCGKLDTIVQMDGDDWNQLLTWAKTVKPLSFSVMLLSFFDRVFEWVKSAVSLAICIFMFIFLAICSIGLIPLLMLLILVLLLSYWFWNKNKTHTTIRNMDVILCDVKSHTASVEVRKKEHRKS